MAFHYRKSLDGDSVASAKDYSLDATYATTAKRGDIVRLNASGNLVLAATGDTTVLGVLVGFNFEGLNVTPKVGKVIVDPETVYQADTVGAGALTVGTAYGIDGSSNLDTADTTTTVAKIVEVVNGKPYVVLTARQLV
jgi:hypothetical protein